MKNINYKFNIQKDINLMIEYVRERYTKLQHRVLDFQKGDKKRLAKLLNPPECFNYDDECDDALWAFYILEICRNLDIVKYDIKGEYAGWHSCEPSFKDNYVEYLSNNKFVKLSPSEKERAILKVLINRDREFYNNSILGSNTLELFSRYGSACNITNEMNYTKVRNKLLQIIGAYAKDKKVLLKDFIAYLEKNHRDLIIDIKFMKKASCKTRYDTIYPKYEYQNSLNLDSDKDAFAIVEGYFVVKFLEGVMAEMQFVELEYDDDFPTDSTSRLPYYVKSFQLTQKFFHIMNPNDTTLDKAKITITPDFKIFIEAYLYQSEILENLAYFAKIKSEDKHLTILEMNKKLCLQNMVTDTKLLSPDETLKLLKIAIPANVEIELKEWGKNSDKFIIYENYGVVEAKLLKKDLQKVDDAIGEYLVTTTNNKYKIVRKPDICYNRLEKKEFVPVKVKQKLNDLDFGVKKTSSKKKECKKQVVTISEENFIGINIKDNKIRKEIVEELSKKDVSPLINDKSGVIIFQDKYRSKYSSLVAKLKKKYLIELI